MDIQFWVKLLAVLLVTYQVQGADLSDTEIYAKCFGRLTNRPVDIDSVDYKAVESGTLEPVAACMKVLARANFVRSGSSKKIKNEKDGVAISMLNNFQQFHQTWFSSYGTVNDGQERNLYGLVDHSEPALFVTDALFGRSHFRNVFTRKSSLRGLRKSVKGTGYYIFGSNIGSLQQLVGPLTKNQADERYDLDQIERISYPRVTQGYLLGVQDAPAISVTNRIGYYKKDLEITEARYRTNYDESQSENISRNFGGGVLGSPAYILMNSESNARLDGGVRVHRRLANNTLTDLLCLSLPNLNKNGQENAYLNRYKNSNLSFRKDRSCAKCHASIDTFADNYRNILTVFSASNTYIRELRAKKVDGFLRPANIKYLREYKVRLNEHPPLDRDTSYIRRSPVGKLYYNNLEGKTVNINTRGLAELGRSISEQIDPYVCATQKYYSFLTGVDININSGEKSNFYKEHRSEVVRMGKRLKSHGSLQKLIEDILKSDAFQSRFPGSERSEEEVL